MNKDSILKHIGKRLAKFRSELGLKQKELAEILGKTTSAVANWEVGRASIPLESLIILMDRYDLNPIWLIRGEGPMFLTELSLIKKEKLDKDELLKELLSDSWIRELLELYIKGTECHAAVGYKLKKLLEDLQEN